MGILDAPPRKQSQLVPSAPLRNFRAALAARTTDPVDVLLVGDSFMGNFRRTFPEKRFINHLRDAAQLKWAGALQGSGYHPCAPDNGAAQSNWVIAGGALRFNGFGLTRMSTGLSTVAHTATLTVDCDRFHLAYSRTNTTGTMGVSIDGGAVQNIVTAGAPNISTRLWDSGALSSGSHTVVVTWVSGNIVLLDGLMAYNGDFASGIRFWDSGYGGTVANHHYTATTTYYTGCDNIKPNLVLLHFGTNELIAGVTATTFTAELKTLIDHILALCPSPKPSIGVLLAWPTSGSDPTLTVANWAAYRAATRTLCNQYGYELLDFYDVVGDIGTTDPLDVTETDFLHPNKNGAYLYADEIMRTILR